MTEKKTARKRAPKKVNYNPNSKASRKNLILVAISALSVIGISALIFISLTSLFSTESYYVLNQNIKAKQLITPDMVEERETAKDTGPVHALSMEEIQRGSVYSKYPLFAGDVVARSNAGPLSGTPLGIPDDWLVTSFTINSTDAVGGILGKGDYVDLIGINETDGNAEGARYIFNNLLILEVKFLNDAYDGDIEGQTILGETMHYTVGLPAEHIGYLHSALAQYEAIKMVKAPTEVNYADRNVSNLDKAFKYGPEIGNIDVIEGSDPTFTEIERDKDGRPINRDISENEDNKTEDDANDNSNIENEENSNLNEEDKNDEISNEDLNNDDSQDDENIE